ncbi:hypothetical protein [Fibrella aquatica]|uniref:hypothetical protein n=1 Tax=Fibrella aquatica TaxID=3242487 RepID=UPI00352216E1
MSHKLLDIHLAQASRSLQGARNNNYSDQHKQLYQDNLVDLLKCISERVEASTNTPDPFVYEIKQALDFIYKSLEVLDSSTLNLIPYETIECLKSALRDWTKNTDNYIIVTSLINELYGFSFDPTLVVGFEQRYKDFKNNYGVDFKSRLIQINFPRALSRDYLASVVYYHELGHFVDTIFKITNTLTRTLFSDYSSNPVGTTTLLGNFFPFINNSNYSAQAKQQIIYNHLGEYFCDLFASQYVGRSLNSYLLYITENNPNSTTSHPASSLRCQLVDDFIDGNANYLVDYIKGAVLRITGKPLCIRHDKPTGNDIYNFLPPIIDNERQLHGLIALGWDIWQGDWTLFKDNMNMDTIPNRDTLYTILNNLIEKSIGNYIVTEKWKKSL